MNKLKYETKSDEYILNKYVYYYKYLNTLHDTLKNLPEKSILGRMGVVATINRYESKFDAVYKEIKKRKLKIPEDK